MKKIMLMIFCLVSMVVYAQQDEIEHFLSVQNLSISNLNSFDKSDNFEPGGVCKLLISDSMSNNNQSNDGENDICLNTVNIKKSANKSFKIEAYSVAINALNGFTFHIADYYDGTRVVTCLDGPLIGLQGISVNGNKTTESSNVDWHKNYFVHYYQYGKVYSYPNRQVIEVY